MSDCPHDTHDHGPNLGNVQNKRQQQEEDREALLDELTDCLDEVEDDSGVERIEQCLKKLEELGEPFPDFDVDRALKEFHAKYDDFSPELFPHTPAHKKPRRPKILRYMARVAVVAAAATVLVVAVQAGGGDVIGTIASWSDSAFQLVWPGRTPEQGPDVPDPDIEYPSLQAALEAYGVDLQLAPSEYPNGANLKKLSVREERESLMFSASYELPSGNLSITFKQGVVLPPSEIEKDTAEVEIYTLAGIDHRIMQDIDRFKAVWDNGLWECRIAGNVSREEIIAMIDSIY